MKPLVGLDDRVEQLLAVLGDLVGHLRRNLDGLLLAGTLGPMYAFMCRTSTIPVTSCSAPIGRWMATHCGKSCARSASSVRKKSARSRSSMFT